MKKASKLFGAGLLAAVVAMVAVLPAAGASAKGVLQLRAGGTPVANGSASSIGFSIDECFIAYNGTVGANNEKKDVLNATSSSGAECSGAESISGQIEKAEFKAGKTSGSVKTTGTVIVTTSPTCVYEFKKPKGTFALGTPGFLFFEGTAKGKLTKATKKTCGGASSVELPFLADASNEAFGEPFEVEVVEA